MSTEEMVERLFNEYEQKEYPVRHEYWWLSDHLEKSFIAGYHAGHSAKIDEIADRAALNMSLSRSHPEVERLQNRCQELENRLKDAAAKHDKLTTQLVSYEATIGHFKDALIRIRDDHAPPWDNTDFKQIARNALKGFK